MDIFGIRAQSDFGRDNGEIVQIGRGEDESLILIRNHKMNCFDFDFFDLVLILQKSANGRVDRGFLHENESRSNMVLICIH